MTPQGYPVEHDYDEDRGAPNAVKLRNVFAEVLHTSLIRWEIPRLCREAARV